MSFIVLYKKWMLQRWRRQRPSVVRPNGFLDPFRVLGHLDVHPGCVSDAAERPKCRDTDLCGHARQRLVWDLQRSAGIALLPKNTRMSERVRRVREPCRFRFPTVKTENDFPARTWPTEN